MLRRSLSVIAIAAAVMAPAAASAQTSVGISATVLTPITAAAERALSFGNVFPGSVKTIAYDNASAGILRINAESGQTVNVSVTSSTVALTCALCTGTPSINANVLTAGYANSSLSATTGGTAVTIGTTAAAVTMAAATMYVYFGADIDPGTSPVAGTYSGDVQFNVTYPAN